MRSFQHLLVGLESNLAPSDWQGGLDVPYFIGPGPVNVELYVNNTFEIRELWNVIGEIKGEQFPDEMILIGNHRDAWVFGAADPNSGTGLVLLLILKSDLNQHQ
jgi:N-acetylated-alpha-linked acidic dipeptidase